MDSIYEEAHAGGSGLGRAALERPTRERWRARRRLRSGGQRERGGAAGVACAWAVEAARRGGKRRREKREKGRRKRKEKIKKNSGSYILESRLEGLQE